MSNCCDKNINPSNNRRILWTVLLLNLSVFGVELYYGLAANSASLIADSVDFMGDALSYALTLFVLTASLRAKAITALVKAGLMLLMGAVALYTGIDNLITGHIPAYTTMGWVGTLALAVNTLCALLLFSLRTQDVNMQSIWLCSRNDVLNNIAILIAAYAVYTTQTLWPDLLAALFIAGLATKSAISIIKDSKTYI